MRRVGTFQPKKCVLCLNDYVPTGGKQKACEECSNEYWKIQHARQMRERSRLRKLEAIQYLGDKCYDCSFKFHPAVYEFHHLNPKEKDMDGSDFLQRKREIMYDELVKCVLLCANCHRIRHHTWENSGV